MTGIQTCALPISAATALSAPITIALVAKTQSLQSFPLEIFLVDALLCAVLVAASRLALRLTPGLLAARSGGAERILVVGAGRSGRSLDRKSTRLNSSHANISY